VSAQSRKNRPRIGRVPSSASNTFAMLIEHETKTILEKRKTKGWGSDLGLNYTVMLLLGREEFPALEGIAVESLT
jgi:hypothetical protein